MMVSIEVLLLAILLQIFIEGSIASLIYVLISVAFSLIYYFVYMSKYKKLDSKEKDNLKSQFSYKFVIVAIMIITINLVYPLGNINLLFGYGILGYSIGVFIYRITKRTLLKKRHLMNFNYLFDCYCILCLLSILKEILEYAI